MNTAEQNAQASHPAESNRRRQYIVHPKVQWRHAITLGAAVFLFCVILSCGLFASLHEEARRRVINPAAYRGSVFTLIISASVVYSALTAGVIGFWMILTTHRICGPAYVMEQSLQQLADGRIPTLRPLRRKDELKEVFATLGRAIDRIRLDKETTLARLASAVSDARSDRYTCEQECREALDSVASQLGEMRKALAQDLGQSTPPATRAPARPQPVALGA